MTKYEQLKSLIAGRQQRQTEAKAKAAALRIELTLLEGQLEVALIDDDHDTAQAIQKEIQQKQQEQEGQYSIINALKNAINTGIDAHKKTKVSQLADDVIDEGLAQVKEMQSQYNDHVKKLERLKMEYMNALDAAGQTYRQSEQIMHQCRYAQEYSTKYKKQGLTGISHGVLRFGSGGRGGPESSFLVDTRQAEKLFFEGGAK